MAKKRLNCWEFMKCGREKMGAYPEDSRICPAATEKLLDGTHGGINAGRACWIVAGTLCKGEMQGKFAHKYRNCGECDFYIKVKEEEFPGFILSAVLLKRIDNY